MPKTAQPQIRVVLAQEQTILGAGSEHAVRLGRPFCHQVVNQDPDVGFVAPKDDGRFLPHPLHGVDSGHQALRPGFFVAGSSIDLPGQKQIPAHFRFQGWMELGREGKVVFHGISGPHDFGVFASDNRVNHLHLNVKWQACGKAVDVDFVGGDSFRFEEKLLSLLFREFHDLILNGRAIARADTFNHARIHG